MGSLPFGPLTPFPPPPPWRRSYWGSLRMVLQFCGNTPLNSTGSLETAPFSFPRSLGWVGLCLEVARVPVFVPGTEDQDGRSPKLTAFALFVPVPQNMTPVYCPICEPKQDSYGCDKVVSACPTKNPGCLNVTWTPDSGTSTPFSLLPMCEIISAPFLYMCDRPVRGAAAPSHLPH